MNQNHKLNYLDALIPVNGSEVEVRKPLSGGVVVIGAGNWGTTIALLMAPHRPTRLWTRTLHQAAQMRIHHCNDAYLPGVKLPEELVIEPVGASPLDPNDLLVIAVPSHSVRATAEEILPIWNGQVIVSCAKGYELHNGHAASLVTSSEVIRSIIPTAAVVAWAGPNIAREIALGMPTRAVLAGRDMAALTHAMRLLKNDRVTFEVSRDLRGVELCSALKGVIAMAVGLGDGLELGDNFTGLLVSYGLREFTAIAEFLGISRETIYGIAGLGDCVTSSLSPFGRNRSFGRLLGRGVPPRQALQEVGMVVEGVQMLLTVAELEDLNVPAPLFSALKEIVFGLFSSEADDTIRSEAEHRTIIRKHLVNTVLHYNTPVQRRYYALEEVA